MNRKEIKIYNVGDRFETTYEFHWRTDWKNFSRKFRIPTMGWYFEHSRKILTLCKNGVIIFNEEVWIFGNQNMWTICSRGAWIRKKHNRRDLGHCETKRFIIYKKGRNDRKHFTFSERRIKKGYGRKNKNY